MGLSGLCLVHCLASTIFFASIASVSGVLENHLFHEIGLVVAIGFALVTLVAGVLSHGYMMPFAVGSFGLGMMAGRSEEHTSELQSLMRSSYAVFCLKKKNRNTKHTCRTFRLKL